MNDDAKNVIERFEESRKWMRLNYYDELTEVFRSIKLRTKPIYKKDAAGKETTQEDKSQTNVCMPAPNIAWRRGVARLSAAPYRMKYTGTADPRVLESLSALAIQQYDRTDEAKVDRRVVMQGKAFGFSYGKLYWDSLARTMVFRKAFLSSAGEIVYRDRASIMRAQGAPEDEIQGAVSELGTEMNDSEIADAIGKSGKEIKVPEEVAKYEGPVVKAPFIGDVFLMPHALSIDDSDFVIEHYSETDLWLLKQVKSVKYLAEDSKTYLPAFDPQACKDLLDTDPQPDKQTDDLKNFFLSVSGRQDDDQYQYPRHLRSRKRFDIIEQHMLGDDGRMWITWVAPNMRTQQLGCMPYPWDLYGKTVYSEFVPLEDMVSAYGDSTVRLMRFLHAMHNRTVAQNFDYITNILKRFILKQQNLDMDEVIVRGTFRELSVADINKVKVMEEPGIPSGAFERESQILRMLALLEPALNTVDTGSATNPMAGKLATTAMINAKAFDALTQFELDGRDLYLRNLGQKKLWMNQQAATEKWEIEQKFWGEELSKRVNGLPPDTTDQPAPEWALSSRYGKTTAVRLDPLEIQEDIGVEPESMSYLSVDDELRKSAAMDLDQVAMAAPDILDRRKVIRFHLSTIRNIGNPDEYLLPEQSGPVPPPFKGSVGVNMPLDKMPSDIVNQVLPMFGLQPSEELSHRDTLDAVSRMNEAGKAATELTSHAESQMQQPGQAGQKPNGKAAKANGKDTGTQTPKKRRFKISRNQDGSATLEDLT